MPKDFKIKAFQFKTDEQIDTNLYTFVQILYRYLYKICIDLYKYKQIYTKFV